MNCRTNTSVIRSISREQEVLHQCDSPVSHITPESHTSSTRDPTRKNFARAVPAPHGSSGDGSSILRPTVITSPQPHDVGTRTEAALCGAINKESGMVNNRAPLPSTSDYFFFHLIEYI